LDETHKSTGCVTYRILGC